ncbi:MAG: YqgE/AlgH family protein [Oligoflexus sp.]
MQVIDTPSLLVALPQLQDPNFFRSIVLLLESGLHGALGFIVNKPSSYTVRDLLAESDLLIPDDIPSWFGGPVEVERGLVLHNQNRDHGATHFAHHVNLSSTIDAVQGLVLHAEKMMLEDEEQSVLYPYRFLIGYAGWGPGQLMEELLNGSWIQMPFSEKLVFDTPWTEMWSEAMRSIGVDPYEIVPSANPYLN